MALALPMLAAAPAPAEPASDPATAVWRASLEEATALVRLEGRPEEGRRRYALCAECHLATGAGDAGGTMPRIAGQHRSVLIKQMLDIRSGRRHNPLMGPYVELLPDRQAIVDVSTHVARMPVPTTNGRGPGHDTARGARLYRERCASCHGAAGEGASESFAPALRGQHYHYLVRQLIDVAGARRDNAFPAMVEAVADLSARDVSSVADFVSRLPVDSAETEGDER